jgi:putative intracellular protease/amidase
LISVALAGNAAANGDVQMKKILIPLPSKGFDPTEVAVPWMVLSQAGHDIVFTTPTGQTGTVDDRMLNGTGLGLLKPILRARGDAVDAYAEMTKTSAFQNPVAYADLREADFDGLVLPGGHDKPVREYLESEILQRLVAAFFKVEKPIAAICHGVVLAARSLDSDTGKSVLHGYKTTALLQKMEMMAYNLTRLYLGDYYLTYPGMTVEGEVREALGDQADFVAGPSPTLRDSPNNLERGFTVLDRHYLSARWPGDAYSFAVEFDKLLQKSPA